MGYFKMKASPIQSYVMHRWDGNEATSKEAGGRGYDLNIRDRARAFTYEKFA